MRIAVIPPQRGGNETHLEDYFPLQALRSLLPEHELVAVNKESSEEFDLVLFLGNRFLGDGFWDKWLLGKPRKCAALGLSLPSDWKWNERTTEKIRQVGKSGGVGVADEATYKKAKEVLASTHLHLSGLPSLFLVSSGLDLQRGGTVFCPTVSDPAFGIAQRNAFARLCRRFYARLNRQNRALFFASCSSELPFGANPGVGTLFAPDHPSVHLKAIGCASSVVGFHPHALMVAIASGIPAVFLGNEVAARNACEAAGIPFLEINPNTNSAELEHRAEEVIRKYPWETVHEKSARLRSAFVEHFKALGVKIRDVRKKTALHEAPKEAVVLNVASILSAQDVPSFLGLYENLISVSARSVNHHVLVLDRGTEALLQTVLSERSVYFYRPSELWEKTDITALLGSKASQKSAANAPIFKHASYEMPRASSLNWPRAFLSRGSSGSSRVLGWGPYAPLSQVVRFGAASRNASALRHAPFSRRSRRRPLASLVV
jgi:hypothetical protein